MRNTLTNILMHPFAVEWAADSMNAAFDHRVLLVEYLVIPKGKGISKGIDGLCDDPEEFTVSHALSIFIASRTITWISGKTIETGRSAGASHEISVY